MPTSVGPIDVPIAYRDGAALQIFWRVDLGQACKLIADKPLEPVTILGQALAVLVVFEYRDTSIGSYHEVGLAVLARRRGATASFLQFLWDMTGQADLGFYVHQLPVTTPRALAAGIELWGYPKYLTSITTSFRPGRVEAVVGSEFKLTCVSASGIKAAAPPIVTFSTKDGRLVRTVVQVSSPSRWSIGGGVRLHVLGHGPTSHAIQSLRLHQRRPLAVCRIDGLRALLPMGEYLAAAT